MHAFLTCPDCLLHRVLRCAVQHGEPAILRGCVAPGPGAGHSVAVVLWQLLCGDDSLRSGAQFGVLDVIWISERGFGGAVASLTQTVQCVLLPASIQSATAGPAFWLAAAHSCRLHVLFP